jgi:hypothetical protein
METLAAEKCRGVVALPQTKRAQRNDAALSKSVGYYLGIKKLVRLAVVVVPVAIGVPPLSVFIPPTVIVSPAILAGVGQFVPRMVRFFAVPAVMVNGFVKVMIGLGHAMLAFGLIRFQVRRAREKKNARERRASQY